MARVRRRNQVARKGGFIMPLIKGFAAYKGLSYLKNKAVSTFKNSSVGQALSRNNRIAAITKSNSALAPKFDTLAKINTKNDASQGNVLRNVANKPSNFNPKNASTFNNWFKSKETELMANKPLDYIHPNDIIKGGPIPSVATKVYKDANLLNPILKGEIAQMKANKQIGIGQQAFDRLARGRKPKGIRGASRRRLRRI